MTPQANDYLYVDDTETLSLSLGFLEWGVSEVEKAGEREEL